MADSVSATVVLPGANPPGGIPPPAAGAPPAAAAPVFSIPDAYKDRPDLKGVDSADKVFAMLDGAQTLIGQRPNGIPAPDAKPEELAKFYDAAGRPKTAAEYQFELDPAVKVDDKLVAQTKDLMYKHGLSAAQAKGLQKDFDQMAIAIAKERGIAMEKQNTDFTKLATDMFGADRDAILARSKTLIDTFTPANLKGEVAKLSNENLVVLAGVLNGIHAKYIKTDGPSAGAPGANGTSETMRAEAMKIMGSPAYINSMDVGHEAAKARVAEIYRIISGGK